MLRASISFAAGGGFVQHPPQRLFPNVDIRLGSRGCAAVRSGPVRCRPVPAGGVLSPPADPRLPNPAPVPNGGTTPPPPDDCSTSPPPRSPIAARGPLAAVREWHRPEQNRHRGPTRLPPDSTRSCVGRLGTAVWRRGTVRQRGPETAPDPGEDHNLSHPRTFLSRDNRQGSRALTVTAPCEFHRYVT